MQLIVRRARQMANGDSAAIAVPRAGAGRLGVVASDGDVDTVGLELSIDDTVAGAVLRSGESMSVNVLHQDEESSPLLARFAGGPAVLIPLGVGDRVRGVVAVGRRPGGLPFTDAVVRMLRAFADQAAVILELADTRREAERFELADDRGRIARDLHDLVIQRLFGSAMTLTGVVRLIDNPDVAGRVERTVDDLDVTIKQIRSTIFALQSRMTGSGATLRSQIVDAVERAAERLGFAPALRLEGLLDTAVPEDLVEHVVAVVQETLSNAVRHARASRVEVWVALVDHHLVVQVSDDGVGVGRVTHRSGLANLTSRAEQLRGSCAIRSPATGGTLVEWRVPI
jgi:signal transduction histidine kinase